MENRVSQAQHKLTDNGICKGWVNHSRLTPKKHEFTYPVFMFYLNIDDIECVLPVQTNHQWFSVFKSWAWRREDYFDGSDKPLKQTIYHWVKEQGYPAPHGPITMLTNVRCFGYLINPITVYFLWDASGEHLDYMIAEVTNTPWRERQRYLLPCRSDHSEKHLTFNKTMHVSPFHDMDIQYRWQSRISENDIQVSIGCLKQGSTIFTASLYLNREEISAPRLRKTLFEYPCMTIKVAWGIYWQAVKLFVKKIPIFPHPKSVK
jgi:DUF1365 family protein